MTKYQREKEQVRQNAIEWFLRTIKNNYSWLDMKHYNDHFEKLGKRYGLLKEFRENGII